MAVAMQKSGVGIMKVGGLEDMNFLDRAKLAARTLFGGTPLSTGNIVYINILIPATA